MFTLSMPSSTLASAEPLASIVTLYTLKTIMVQHTASTIKYIIILIELTQFLS